VKVEERAALIVLKKKRRRLSSAAFFVAGIGFGTLLYLLRARFQLLREEGRWSGALALLGITVGAFWLGARADAEVRRLEHAIGELEKKLPPRQ
jgi:hypothetical protein